MTLHALGGGELVGENMARHAYVDEAGIANPKHEPVIVVAGIILHVDTQWRALHEHFNTLLVKHVPEGKRDGFVFHAKDIWHGEGNVFGRDVWRGGDRREALFDLCRTVGKFKLPVVWGHTDRKEVAEALEYDNKNPISLTRISFMSAFVDCAVRAEMWMNKYGMDECLSFVVENNNDFRNFAKAAYRELKKKDSVFNARISGRAPIRHIIDGPSFMEKEDAPPLQLADASAFVIKRYFSGRNDVAEYMHHLLPSMMYAFDESKLRDLEEKLRAENPDPE